MVEVIRSSGVVTDRVLELSEFVEIGDLIESDLQRALESVQADELGEK